jgi:hypothetical protein
MSEQQKAMLLLKLSGLCTYMKVHSDFSHGFIYSELAHILNGTKFQYLLKIVINCKTSQSLQKFVYTVYLNVCGLSESRLKIKTRGKYMFELDSN